MVNQMCEMGLGRVALIFSSSVSLAMLVGLLLYMKGFRPWLLEQCPCFPLPITQTYKMMTRVMMTYRLRRWRYRKQKVRQVGVTHRGTGSGLRSQITLGEEIQ